MRRSFVAGAASAALAVSMVCQADAQSVAVSGKTPANPQLLISIPDTAALWNGFSASTGGQAVIDYVRAQDWFTGAHQQRLQSLEEDLGFSLSGEELMTKTLSGLDFYLVEQGPRTGFVINAQFNNPETPHKILDQLIKEAEASRGVSGGVSADTVVESRDESGRVLSLPAFQIYMAVQGNILTYSNAKASLDSTMADEGRALFDSDYFSRYMSSLQNDPSVAWMFGEFAQIGAFIPHVDPSMLEQYATAVAGAKLDATESHMKLTMFRHQETMQDSERRYALSAPPPGDIEVFNYFPASTALAIGTNYFDGAELLNGILDDLESAGSTVPVDRDTLEQQLQNSRMLLGFDVRNDLLYNLGPDLGIALGGFDLAASSGAPFPTPDLLFVTKVKDRDSFTTVLDRLSMTINQMLAPPPGPAPKVEEGQPTPTPSPTPEPAVKSASVQGEEVMYVDSSLFPAGEVTPAWSLTQDSRFLLSLDRGELEKALASGSGGSDTLMTTPRYRKAAENLDQLMNTLVVADMEAIVGLLDSQEALIAGDMTPEKAAQYQDGMNILRQISGVATCTSYKNNGKRQELLLMMKE